MSIRRNLRDNTLPSHFLGPHNKYLSLVHDACGGDLQSHKYLAGTYLHAWCGASGGSAEIILILSMPSRGLVPEAC